MQEMGNGSNCGEELFAALLEFIARKDAETQRKQGMRDALKVPRCFHC
jgi:hypothetical protein